MRMTDDPRHELGGGYYDVCRQTEQSRAHTTFEPFLEHAATLSCLYSIRTSCSPRLPALTGLTPGRGGVRASFLVYYLSPNICVRCANSLCAGSTISTIQPSLLLLHLEVNQLRVPCVLQ